jgi:hypothetical protein
MDTGSRNRRDARPEADDRQDHGAQPLRRDGQYPSAQLVDEQDRDDDPEAGERRESDPTGEPTAEAVLLQHAVGEGGSGEPTRMPNSAADAIAPDENAVRPRPSVSIPFAAFEVLGAAAGSSAVR